MRRRSCLPWDTIGASPTGNQGVQMRASFTLAALLVGVISIDAQTSPRIESNAVVFVEASEFGQALQAAMVKKKVPLLVTTNREKAALFLEETSKAEKEGTGERVAKVIALGVF